MLLVGRALQGLGAAGIMNLTRIVLSDNVSLADNSKNNTVFSLIAGIRYVLALIPNLFWRYVRFQSSSTYFN
jgi:MFS family permease